MIFGRGACDDKGPLAAGLAAILDLHRDLGVAPAYDITFAGSIDEECTMSGAERLAAELDGWDLCIALEPTDLKIIRAHKGVYRCRVTTRGKAAHSSHPEKGRNAITAMIPIINDIDELRVRLARKKRDNRRRRFPARRQYRPRPSCRWRFRAIRRQPTLQITILSSWC